MGTTKVYDLPTRLFHWMFVGLFVTAFLIAKTVDDESAVFSYHMLMGIVLSFIVGLRILWGIVGSHYARFSSYALNPRELMDYFEQLLTGKTPAYAGHNPASSWAAILMIIFALGLGLTGCLMSTEGNKETYEDVHELLANGFLVTALAHVAGVTLHTLRYRDWIGLSMITGNKKLVGSQKSLPHSHSGVALVFVALVVGWVANLYKNYDPQTQTLNLFGNPLIMGESKNEGDEKNEDSAYGLRGPKCGLLLESLI